MTDSVLDFTVAEFEPLHEELAAIQARFEQSCFEREEARLKKLLLRQAEVAKAMRSTKERICRLKRAQGEMQQQWQSLKGRNDELTGKIERTREQVRLSREESSGARSEVFGDLKA